MHRIIALNVCIHDEDEDPCCRVASLLFLVFNTTMFRRVPLFTNLPGAAVVVPQEDVRSLPRIHRVSPSGGAEVADV